jgi:hypothetical protein
MLKATLIFHSKRWYDDGAILELKLWQVPSPVAGSLHEFRYSLFYGKDRRRIVGYDNEAGKGDHRHYGDREEDYEFSTKEKLVEDFLKDVERARNAA